MKTESTTKLNYHLLQLQNRIKRDPLSYCEEFHKQFEHYKSLLELFKLNPQEYHENVADLVMFLAQVSSAFREELKDYPQELMTLLKDYASVLDRSMRLCLCRALILMRNRGIVPPTDLIKLFFELLRCKDKMLRKYIQIHIVADLKRINAKHKAVKVNTAIQNFMFKMLLDSNDTAAKVSLDIMIELYKRHVWRDTKTVNAIATACFSKVNKVLVAAHEFFLGSDEDEEEKNDSSDSEDDGPNLKEVMMANKVSKKSRKRDRILKRTKQVLKRKEKKKEKEVFDFSAIHLLHDPQGMSEKLLKSLQSMNERFEIKLMIMNLISRLIGVHSLILLNYYPLLIRYLRPHQRDVTKILMFAAQASHEDMPPDALEPVLRTIADNFITERNSSEVITVGLNAIRELCMRCPLAISQDLLQDLVQYQKYKNKNVMMAARSLIQLFRKINPKMLQRRFRSKPTEATAELTAFEFGASKAKSYIPGSEVLPVDPETAESLEDEKAEDNGNESDGSWVNVSHSEDEIWSSADEEEEEDSKKKKDRESNSLPEDKTNPDDLKKNESKENKNASPTEVVDIKEKAAVVSQSRILSQEDFRKMKVAQLSKEIRFVKGKKRTAEDNADAVEIDRPEIVSLRRIEKLHKRPKLDRETRLATVMEGREDREKFGRKKAKLDPNASKTNKQRNKNKAFMMIKHKVKKKIKRSFKDKQIALRDALIKRRRNQ